jgi:hypothetical protein
MWPVDWPAALVAAVIWKSLMTEHLIVSDEDATRVIKLRRRKRSPRSGGSLSGRRGKVDRPDALTTVIASAAKQSIAPYQERLDRVAALAMTRKQQTTISVS